MRFLAALPILVAIAATPPLRMERMRQNELRMRSGGVNLCGNGVINAGESCDDGNRVDGDGCSYNCQTEFFFRDFRLNASTLSTPQLPQGASIAFTALSDAGFQCTTGVETVTQGTSPVTYLGPLGYYALDMTGQAVRPVVSAPSAAMQFVLSGGAGHGVTIAWIGSPTNVVEGPSGVLPTVKWDTGVSQWLGRWENDNGYFLRAPTSAGVNEANAANGLPGLGGYGIRWISWDGGEVYVRAGGSSGSPQPLASFTVGANAPFRFNADDGTGNPDFTSGELQGLYIFDGGLNDVPMTSTEMAYAGMRDSAASPVVFTRGSRAWIYAGAANEPYAPNMPIVSARGWESAPGNDSSSGSNRQTGNGFCKLGLPNCPKYGTPSFSDAGVGPCTRYSNGSTAFLMVGDAGEGIDGDGGTTGVFGDPTKAGEANVSAWVMPGTSGSTTNEVCLGFDTDWVQLDGGVVGDMHFQLDAGWQAITYPVYLGLIDGGNPDGGHGTYVYGHIKLCGADAGKQSVIVDKWPWANWGQGATDDRCDNVHESSDFLSIPNTEVTTWPDGQADAGADIEVIFAQNFSSPAETTGLPLLNWEFIQADGGITENYLFIDSTDATGFAQPTLDVGWRNSSYQGTCVNQSINGLTDTKSNALPNIQKGIIYAARALIIPAGTVAGVPRVNHYLYFDACPNQADTTNCHATTLVGSSVGQGKCASEAADFSFAVLGREINNTPVVSSSVNPMNGVVKSVAVRKAMKALP